MKKGLLISALVIGVILVGFRFIQVSKQGKINQVVVEYGHSKKFHQKEIQDAMDCVFKEFRSFEGCNLERLWYDEDISNAEYGIDNINGIVLLSDFYVDASGEDNGFEPNSEQIGWKWLLVRDSKTSEWLLKSYGYA